MFFMLCSISMNAQNEAIDSLLIALNKSTEDSIRVSLLNQVAYSYHRINIDSTTHYGNLALTEAKKTGNKYGESRAYNILGIPSIFHGEYPEALNLNAKSYELAQELESVYLTCVSSNAFCVIYDRLNNIELSIYYGKIALEAAKELKDTMKVGYILSNLSEFHFEEGNYEESALYSNQVLELAKEANDCNLLSVGNLYSGKLDLVKKDFIKAKNSFDEALFQADQCNDEYIASLGYYWLSQIAYAQQDYSKAIDHIEKSNVVLEKIGGIELHLENYLAKAEILIKLDKHKQAQQVLKEGLAISKESKQIEHEVKYLDELANINKLRKEYTLAFNYIDQSKILKDSIEDFNKAISMLELERKYNLEKKEVEVQLLQEQKQKDAQIIKSRSYFIIASTLFAALIGVIAFFTQRNLRKEEKYNSELESNVKKRTLELEQSNKMLHESNEELERFAYISSHDLKQPLKNILSFTNLIKEESIKANHPKITEYSTILENCSGQLNTLVSDILDYSLVKNNIEMRNVDLNEIVEQLKSDLDETIKSKNAIITNDHLPNIKSDKSQMYQAFKNIIENGIKYNNSDIPKVNISTEENDGSLKIKFHDNGIGIDPKYHEHIFQMFNRLHNKDEYPGSGIGLSAVKTIANKLNGEVIVESNLEEGSEFTLILPKV